MCTNRQHNTDITSTKIITISVSDESDVKQAETKEDGQKGEDR